MKKIITVILLLLSIFTIGCHKEQIIGGDKDAQGCLVSAGYSWNENITACTRSWELDDSQIKAAQIAVAPMSVMPRTITKVETLKCPGCFNVQIRSGDSESTIQIRDWKINNGVTNFEECVSAGNPVMESYPRQCSVDGKTYVEDLTHVCTEEESKNVACTLDYNPVCGEMVLNMGKTIYQTYGNGCSACATMKVVSYVPGECPADKTTELCSDGKGNYITLKEATDIAKESECGDNLVIDSCTCQNGYRKDGESCNPECYYSKPACLSPSFQCEKSYTCNEGTGTFWINTNLTKQGCSPACVINLETKNAEINWRCTGLITN